MTIKVSKTQNTKIKLDFHICIILWKKACIFWPLPVSVGSAFSVSLSLKTIQLILLLLQWQRLIAVIKNLYEVVYRHFYPVCFQCMLACWKVTWKSWKNRYKTVPSFMTRVVPTYLYHCTHASFMMCVF